MLRGAATLTDAITQAQQGHRNYAKRQATWFRKDPTIHWIEGFGDEAETMAVALHQVRAHLQA